MIFCFMFLVMSAVKLMLRIFVPPFVFVSGGRREQKDFMMIYSSPSIKSVYYTHTSSNFFLQK